MYGCSWAIGQSRLDAAVRAATRGVMLRELAISATIEPAPSEGQAMWLLELIGSILSALPWILAAVIGTMVAIPMLTICGWGVVVIADVFGYNLFPDRDFELAGGWDPDEFDDLDGEVANGCPA
ncbi:hypothetical protein HY480_03330 [Candidatus Uhrbacteria bacterium]|nr:hypothetical protein [Candidatus Uhrbacteria bacterium]